MARYFLEDNEVLKKSEKGSNFKEESVLEKKEYKICIKTKGLVFDWSSSLSVLSSQISIAEYSVMEVVFTISVHFLIFVELEKCSLIEVLF